jgi:RNA polymerase sigma factor (sigma-70 family)
MAEYEDKALMQDLFTGKESAFREIYDRYYEKLYFISFGIVHHTQEAEDIVIVTLRKLFERHASFQHIQQVQSWLFLTARNNCIDALRKRKNAQLNLKKVVDPEQDVENQSFNNELDALLVERLFQLIEELPKQSKQVIKLRYLDGLKYKDIGAILNISPRTVENLSRYALDRLRNTMNNKKLAIFIFLFANLFPFNYSAILNFL